MSKVPDAKTIFGNLIRSGRARESRHDFAYRVGVDERLIVYVEHGCAPNDKGPQLVHILNKTHNLSEEEKERGYIQLRRFCHNCPPRYRRKRMKFHLHTTVLFQRKPNRRGRWLQF